MANSADLDETLAIVASQSSRYASPLVVNGLSQSKFWINICFFSPKLFSLCYGVRLCVVVVVAVCVCVCVEGGGGRISYLCPFV